MRGDMMGKIVHIIFFSYLSICIFILNCYMENEKDKKENKNV